MGDVNSLYECTMCVCTKIHTHTNHRTTESRKKSPARPNRTAKVAAAQSAWKATMRVHSTSSRHGASSIAMQSSLPSSHAARRALRGLESTTPSPLSPSKLKVRTSRYKDKARLERVSCTCSSRAAWMDAPRGGPGGGVPHSDMPFRHAHAHATCACTCSHREI